jgi:hypothetical protein
MQYAEMAYFDGNHCAHCAAWQEHNRLVGIHNRARASFARERRARPRYEAIAA